jgi:hypothetical protein
MLIRWFWEDSPASRQIVRKAGNLPLLRIQGRRSDPIYAAVASGLSGMHDSVPLPWPLWQQ